jgi:hypothetical protein
MQMIGRTDGENAVKAGEGFMFEKIKEYNNNRTLQLKFPRVGDYIWEITKDTAQRFRRERRESEGYSFSSEESVKRPEDLVFMEV